MREAVFRQLSLQFNYEEYAGAIVCGLVSVAVKCHGQSSAKGVLNAILGAANLVQHRFTQQIK